LPHTLLKIEAMLASALGHFHPHLGERLYQTPPQY
jgi:hypothetical protein